MRGRLSFTDTKDHCTCTNSIGTSGRVLCLVWRRFSATPLFLPCFPSPAIFPGPTCCSLEWQQGFCSWECDARLHLTGPGNRRALAPSSLRSASWCSDVLFSSRLFCQSNCLPLTGLPRSARRHRISVSPICMARPCRLRGSCRHPSRGKRLRASFWCFTEVLGDLHVTPSCGALSAVW